MIPELKMRERYFAQRLDVFSALLPQIDFTAPPKVALTPSLLQKTSAKLDKLRTKLSTLCWVTKVVCFVRIYDYNDESKPCQLMEKEFCSYCHRNTKRDQYFLQLYQVVNKNMLLMDPIDATLNYVKLF